MKKMVLLTATLFIIVCIILFAFLNIRSVRLRFKNEQTFLPKGISDYYYDDFRGVDEYTVWGYSLNNKEQKVLDGIIAEDSNWKKAVLNDTGCFNEISYYIENTVILDSSSFVFFSVLHNGQICCIYNQTESYYYVVLKTM